jgi:uncharacterized membrane protein/predicted DsbA family dithiol-disulfide isomerase
LVWIEGPVTTIDKSAAGAASVNRGSLWVIVVASLCGLGLSGELTRLHFVLERTKGYESFCNLSATVNCDAVATSSYSVLFGVPLSVWGLFAYAFALGMAIWGLVGRRLTAVFGLVLLGAIATAGAVVLAYLSLFRIHSLCLLCMGSWLVDVTLFGASMHAARKASWRAVWKDVQAYTSANSAWVAMLVASAVFTFVLVGRMVSPSADRQTHEAVRTPLASASVGAASGSGAPPSPEVPTGTDERGHHYIGASHPSLTIEEFSDYQCPFCAKAHETLRALVEKYPASIRIVHRHFPLDNDCNPAIKKPFHTHACYYARLAACAGSMGKFWPANDHLFKHGRDEAPVALETLARTIEVDPAALRTCLGSKAADLLKSDLDDGVRLNLEGTPSFVIDGQVHTGPLPRDILEKYPL